MVVALDKESTMLTSVACKKVLIEFVFGGVLAAQ
jgi:hypothetical protein